MTVRLTLATSLSVAGLLLSVGLVYGAGQYGPGASDTEIKIGKAEAAYFDVINKQGGINGRKINFISRDDSYSPPKTVELVRQLVEQDQVLLTFQVLGTPPNTAVQGYLNENKVPQMFVATGADKWNDPKRFPWTIG